MDSELPVALLRQFYQSAKLLLFFVISPVSGLSIIHVGTCYPVSTFLLLRDCVTSLHWTKSGTIGLGLVKTSAVSC